MKFLVLGVAVLALVVGCARPPTPKAGTVSTSDECSQVYDRWLAIGAITGYGARPSSSEEMKVGKQMLDDVLRQNGTTAKFFHSCTTTMNEVQATCMLQSNTLDELHTCAELYKN